MLKRITIAITESQPGKGVHIQYTQTDKIMVIGNTVMLLFVVLSDNRDLAQRQWQQQQACHKCAHLMRKHNDFCMQSTPHIFVWCPLTDNDMKCPNFKCCGGCQHMALKGYFKFHAIWQIVPILYSDWLQTILECHKQCEAVFWSDIFVAVVFV